MYAHKYGMGVDPGAQSSAFLVVNLQDMSLEFARRVDNEDLAVALHSWNIGVGADKDTWFIAVERVVSYGKPVGNDTFKTAEWSGRFYQAARHKLYVDVEMISRPDIKVSLCGSTTFISENNARKAVTESMLKAVVKSKFPSTGGGKNPVIGTKAQPGPLYEFPKGADGGEHCWAAAAVLFGALETCNDG